jgi:molecular chaperone GrpE (heat shock protein)
VTTLEAVAEPVESQNYETTGESASKEEAMTGPLTPERETSGAVESGETGAEMLNALVGQMDSLVRSVEEANRLAQERERIIDRLHQENQQLRQGELQQAILPIFRDLIRLYDDLRQTARGQSSRSEVTPQQTARDFECFAEMVTDILYRQGVERYEAREGEAFNPKEHRVLGASPTAEQSKDRTIARSIRDGFRTDTRPVRLLEAEVYRYTPRVATSEPDEAQANE